MTTEEYLQSVKKAVGFWVEALGGDPQHDCGFAEGNFFMQLAASTTDIPSPEQISKFQQVLEEICLKEQVNVLDVDYHPDPHLAKALSASSIHPMRLPVKSVTRIQSNGRVVARRGYGSQWVDL